MDDEQLAATNKKLDEFMNHIRDAARKHLEKVDATDAKKKAQQSQAADSFHRMTERTRRIETAEHATETIALGALESAFLALTLLVKQKHEKEEQQSTEKAEELEIVDGSQEQERAALEDSPIDIDAETKHDPLSLEGGRKALTGGASEKGEEIPALEGAAPLALPEGAGPAASQGAAPALPAPAASGASAASGSPAAGAGGGAAGAGGAMMLMDEAYGGPEGSESQGKKKGAGSKGDDDYKPFPLPERTGPTNANVNGAPLRLTAGRR